MTTRREKTARKRADASSPDAQAERAAIVLYLRKEAQRKRELAASLTMPADARVKILKIAELFGRAANEIEGDLHLAAGRATNVTKETSSP